MRRRGPAKRGARLPGRFARPDPRELRLPMGAGGYALAERIATGGMAELFLARREGPGGVAHPVVIKRLRPEMERDPAVVRMFLREAWISARLGHPNVVRFHDFVRHRGRHHLVLEHVPGCDLAAAARHLAAAGRPFPIPEAIGIALGLLRALGHAHALRDDDGCPLGLVHRDVSPQNVLLSREGEVKLADFGVATATAAPRDSGAGLVKGKLGYLSPEQLRGGPVDARADLFGVGVILHELVAGRRLFHGDTEAEQLASALAGEVPALAPLRPECPALLEGIVRRALSRAPEDRFGSAAEMADALAEVGAAAPPQAIAALVREVLGAPAAAPAGARASAARGASAPPASVDRDRSTARLAAAPAAPRSRPPARPAPLRLLDWAVAALALAAWISRPRPRARRSPGR